MVVSVPISLIKDSIWQLILLISLVVMAMTTSTEAYSIPILMLPTTQQIWIKHGHRKTRMLHYHVYLNSTNQNGNSTLYLIKSDYISLQDITLSYQLPADFTQHIGLSALKIYLTGNNLYLWSKRKGYDPRASLTGVSNSYRYSLLSSVSLGFKLNF